MTSDPTLRIRATESDDRVFDSVDAVKRRNGPGAWREPIAASPELRSVLQRWLPGEQVKPHRHALAGELFLVIEGRAEVEIGGGPSKIAGPGSILYAPRGQCHAFRVMGDEPMLMLCFLASNSPGDSAQCEEEA